MVDPRIIQITVDRLSIETHGFEDLWKTPNQDMNHPQISALPLQPRSREHENTFQKSSGSLQNMTRPMTTTTTKNNDNDDNNDFDDDDDEDGGDDDDDDAGVDLNIPSINYFW